MAVKLCVIESKKRTCGAIEKAAQSNGNFVVAHVAHDGEHGRNILEGQDFDAVIMGIILPRADGLSLLTDYRKQNGRDGRVFALISSVDNFALAREAHAEADLYAAAPFDFDALLKDIHRIHTEIKVVEK